MSNQKVPPRGGKSVPKSLAYHIIGRDGSRFVQILQAICAVVVFFGLWEFSVSVGLIPFRSFSSPSAIIEAIWQLAWQGDRLNGVHFYLYEHVYASMRRILPGLVIGSVVGYLLAIWLALLPRTRYIAVLISAVVYGISATALYVVFQHWFGLGEMPKILVMFWISFGVQLVLVYWRCQSILYYKSASDAALWQELFDWLSILGGSRWRLFRDHFVPLLLWDYFLALMMGAAISWKLTVFTEQGGEQFHGVGALVIEGRGINDVTLIFAGVFVLIACTGVTWGFIWLIKSLVLRHR